MSRRYTQKTANMFAWLFLIVLFIMPIAICITAIIPGLGLLARLLAMIYPVALIFTMSYFVYRVLCNERIGTEEEEEEVHRENREALLEIQRRLKEYN